MLLEGIPPFSFFGPVTTTKIAVNSKVILFPAKKSLVSLWQEDSAGKPQTTGDFVMMKKTCLCILGLLLLGMLSVPVAAETKDQGSWNFTIIDRVIAVTHVNINGVGDNDAGRNQWVYVPDSLDHVEVHVVVTAGPDTNVNITKDYIDQLWQSAPSGQIPALIMWGGCATYDVDAGWIDPRPIEASDYSLNRMYEVYEHLKERGLVHKSIGETYYIRYHTLHDRYVTE